MNMDFLMALEQFENEKGISKDILIDAIKQAVLNAYKKNYQTSVDVEVVIDMSNGDIKIINPITIVDDEKEDVLENEMTQEYAQRYYGKTYNIGDTIMEEVTPMDFGRIATQAARQIVVQKIKEAEKEIQYEEFKKKESEIIIGEVTRISRTTVFVDINIVNENNITISIEGILPKIEQMSKDDYKIGSRMEFYILEVKKTTSKTQVILSRSHPGLVKRLFEREVPEIKEGIVEIKSIAREKDSRTKMAVLSNNENVDPIGACVGNKGQRVKNVIEEINNEKIDIIEYKDDIKEYIIEALSPAEVLDVQLNEEEKIATVLVPKDKLSLAIGKEGQNARLAAKLTNWKIDINC